MSYPEIWEDSDRSYLDLYLLAQMKQNTEKKKKENKQMHRAAARAMSPPLNLNEPRPGANF